MPTALVIGSNGQDGTYLTRLLVQKQYAVVGVDRNGRNIETHYHYAADIRDRGYIREIVRKTAPDEVYFLAAYHHSSEAFPIPEEELIATSLDVNVTALNHVLGAVADFQPEARVLYASSSRVFGEVSESTQNETTPRNPVDPYGISKAVGMDICRYWLRTRGIFAVSAVLYNHESPLRGAHFLSQKIVKAAVATSRGRSVLLHLGNISAQVDWGHAADAVRAMWLMLQQPKPHDYVVSTGQLHSVRDWLTEAYGRFGLDWKLNFLEVDDLLNRDRPATVLCGDSSRLRAATGWQPEFTFEALVHDMVLAELARPDHATV
jgi:GDPmannose 4,6-dehydratase